MSRIRRARSEALRSGRPVRVLVAWPDTVQNRRVDAEPDGAAQWVLALPDGSVIGPPVMALDRLSAQAVMTSEGRQP